MATEEVTLSFSDDAIETIADIAVELNSSVENIGARRLQTVMEKILEDISFNAPDRSGDSLEITGEFVRENVGELAKNADLSRYIL
jgi:ATP-dependent HslUV protease ATP-binding subunit HslU